LSMVRVRVRVRTCTTKSQTLCGNNICKQLGQAIALQRFEICC